MCDVNDPEIDMFAPKVGVKVPVDTRDDATALGPYRAAFVDAICDRHDRSAGALMGMPAIDKVALFEAALTTFDGGWLSRRLAVR